MRRAMNQSTDDWNSIITMMHSHLGPSRASRKRTRQSLSLKRLRYALSIVSVGIGSSVLKSIRSIQASALGTKRRM